MRSRLTAILRLVGWSVMLAATGAANAQTNANGPYYATPSWDQKLQCDTQATCPRFIVLSNWNSDAVLDRETGLVWERSPSTSVFNWIFAHLHCNTLSAGNRQGWRLPTYQELSTVRDPTVPAFQLGLPAGHPFDAAAFSAFDVHWSATSRLEFDGQAWTMDFKLFGFVFGAPKTATHLAWCVRGGQGVDTQ